jgi:hypothetical protein
MMVAMGHGLCEGFCVYGETMKNDSDLTKLMANWSLFSLSVNFRFSTNWYLNNRYHTFDSF